MDMRHILITVTIAGTPSANQNKSSIYKYRLPASSLSLSTSIG